MSHLPMLGARDAGSLRGDDFHETPLQATCALMRVESFGPRIWEPACGNGAISRYLVSDYAKEVVSTDLVQREHGTGRIDFLLERELRAPEIITNPPFKLAAEFAEHALRLDCHKLALLCRLGWLEGNERGKFFASYPMSRIWVFSRRLPMMRRHDYEGPKSTSAIAFAWFVWETGFKGSPVLGWV